MRCFWKLQRRIRPRKLYFYSQAEVVADGQLGHGSATLLFRIAKFYANSECSLRRLFKRIEYAFFARISIIERFRYFAFSIKAQQPGRDYSRICTRIHFDPCRF